MEKAKLKKRISEVVESNQGCKLFDLSITITCLIHRQVESDVLLTCLEEMVASGELIEVEYVTKKGVNSFFLSPDVKLTRIISKGKILWHSSFDYRNSD